MEEDVANKTTHSIVEEKTATLFQYFDEELTRTLNAGVLDDLISSCVVMIDDRYEIMEQRTPYQRNRALLDLLIRRPYPTFMLLADALEASEPDNPDIQDFVHRMREHKEETYTVHGEQVLCDFERKAKLQKNYKSIVCNLSMITIIDHLVASKCLRNEEYESIKALPTNYTQIRRFIDILSKKGKHSYNKFLEALRTDSVYKDLADEIDCSELTPWEIFRFNTGVKDLQTREAIRRMGIPWNIYEKMEKKINEWKEDDKLFINTKASAEVIKRVKEQKCVVITGNSGSGKTYIAHHTALKMREEGYIILPVDKPDEIKQYHKSGTKTVFVLDDLFGRFTLNNTLFDEWKLSLQSIESVLKVTHCKILATCRLQIFSNEKLSRNISFLNETDCNICSDVLSLGIEEKIQFAQKYLKGYDDSYAELYSEYDFFPLICKLFKDKESKELNECLKNPFKVIKEDIETLFTEDDDGRKKCCGLILCVIFNNQLTDNTLMSDEMLPCIADVFEKCHLSRTESRDAVKSLLKQMEGVYISITDGKYRIIHDKLFDFLSSHFGNKMTPLFIKYSDHEFISERFIWTDDKQFEDQEEMRIRIEENTTNEYLTRLETDLTTGYIQSVFVNRNMESDLFRHAFLNWLRKHSECQWINKMDNTSDDTPLYLICFYNDIEFVKWLLDRGAIVNKGREDNSTPLHIACQEGYVEIVKLLINHSADINLTSKRGVTPLNAACHMNRIDVVRELLQCEGIDINKADDKGFTPLHAACQEGYIEIVRLLINHSADINLTTNEGVTSLKIACHNNRIDVVRELLQCEGIDINKADDKGFTPLHAACQEAYIEIVRLLINHSADINLTTNVGITPLRTACNNNRIDVVRELLQCVGIDINKADDDGFTPLHMACQEGYIEIVSQLINHSADINLTTNEGVTSLNKACYNNRIDGVRELLQCEGIDINKADDDGFTPLHMACQEGYIEIVSQLINHSADINLTTNEGVTPLKSACNNNRIDGVRELLQCEGIDINKADDEGYTPLHAACQEGYIEIVSQLINHSADINLTSNEGVTSLKIACHNNRIDVVRELLQCEGIDIIKADNQGFTPLHIACQEGYIEIARLLINHSANINLTTNEGVTPLRTACHNNRIDVVRELLQCEGIDINKADDEGYTPLHAACQEGYIEIVSQLINHSADINLTSNQGVTSLQIACHNNRIDVVRELLQCEGIDINRADNNGETALFCACQEGHTEIVKLLLQQSIDIGKSNKHGTTPLSTAFENDHIDVVTLLKQHKFKIAN